MNPDAANSPNTKRDLTRDVSALFFWGLPIAMLIAGGAWPQRGVWLWVIAFAIMGAGCAINMARCGRTHCYVTAPAFFLAALWSLLSAVGLVTMHPNFLILAVVVVTCLAYVAEIPLGRYIGVTKEAQG